MPRRASRERRQHESLNNRIRYSTNEFTSNNQAQAYIDGVEKEYLISMKRYRERLEEAERLRNQSWCEWFRTFLN